jgi:hypothetical protein
MGDTLRPYAGNRVLEIGAGIATLTNQFIPRELYVASDINPNYLHYLRSYSDSVHSLLSTVVFWFIGGWQITNRAGATMACFVT